jgi:uncharacterized OB-fold protein
MSGENVVKYIGTPAKVKEDGGAWVIEFPRSLTHFHTYGKLTPYFKGLTEGKLMATRCTNPKCRISKGNGEMWLPPRADCPDCYEPMQWVEVKQPIVGKIYSYTEVKRGGTGLEIEAPYYQIDIKLENCCTIPKGYLCDSRKEPKTGTKVTPVFRTKDPTHTSLDIAWKAL